MVKITVDGKVLEVDENNNLLEEVLSHGEDLPYFCWHPSMGSVGSCRQCAVIEYADDEDTRGRLNMACMTSPRDGARYSIEKAAQFRAQAIESIMINHPHDCPVCEEGGECHLQDMTVMSGHNYRRYDGKKKTHTNQYLGPFIGHEMNRCITCYRCVRYYKDYAGGTDFGPQASHDNTYFGRWQEGPLESEFSGNLAEVCPTGVFTDKPFSKHYVRKWDLQTAPSICASCSVGCNTNPGERYGTLRRVVNRFNDEVNGYFICDRGRFGTGYVNSDERITVSMTRDSRDANPVLASPEEARTSLHSMMGAIGIGSPRASLEANFALRELVGPDNFYAGVSSAELGMYKQILDIYRTKPVKVARIKDIEASDAVVILGEDVTNTAARLALAMRQSVKNEGRKMARDMKFPDWHDAAIRQLAMDCKSPLFILSPYATRLDDVAAQVHIASAEESAKIGYAIATAIDGNAPGVTGLSKESQALVKTIAEALKGAEQPLIVSGTGSMSPALINAAANIATALSDGEKKANLALVVPEANSLGLAMLMEESDRALEQAFACEETHAIVLENDLYRRAPSADVDAFINKMEGLAVLDSMKHKTGEAANLVLASGTFAETSGTFVNYETRAQHFYSVFKPVDSIQSSVKWLSDKPLAEVTADCAKEIEGCAAIVGLTPGADFTVAGMRVPRQQHRYSGRTAMRADVDVHEPKQEQDEDGIMSYSMEGVPATRDSTVFNTAWSGGWNSNQSVFKFQSHTGGPLKQAGHGICLIENIASEKTYNEFEKAESAKGDYQVFPLYHLFGSDELTAKTPAIQEKATSGYIALNEADVAKLGLQASDGVAVENNGSVPYIVRSSIQPGTVGVSVGLEGLNFRNLPGAVSLQKAEGWTSPGSWNAANIIISDKSVAAEGETA